MYAGLAWPGCARHGGAESFVLFYLDSVGNVGNDTSPQRRARHMLPLCASSSSSSGPSRPKQRIYDSRRSDGTLFGTAAKEMLIILYMLRVLYLPIYMLRRT